MNFWRRELIRKESVRPESGGGIFLIGFHDYRL